MTASWGATRGIFRLGPRIWQALRPARRCWTSVAARVFSPRSSSDRVGASAVTAVDPSESFVEAVRERAAGCAARACGRRGAPVYGCELRCGDRPVRRPLHGRPRRRVARDGPRHAPGWGRHGMCVGSLGGRPGAVDVVLCRLPRARFLVPRGLERPGTRPGHLAELFREAGIGGIEESTLTIAVEHPSFEEWWAPFELGVGPTSAFVESLDPDRKKRLLGAHLRRVARRGTFRRACTRLGRSRHRRRRLTPGPVSVAFFFRHAPTGLRHGGNRYRASAGRQAAGRTSSSMFVWTIPIRIAPSSSPRCLKTSTA